MALGLFLPSGVGILIERKPRQAVRLYLMRLEKWLEDDQLFYGEGEVAKRIDKGHGRNTCCQLLRSVQGSEVPSKSTAGNYNRALQG